MNNKCIKTITTGIILLFIGVSFSSGISIDTETAEIYDCGCNEIDDVQLVMLEKQLNRLKVYSKLLLVLSRYNPELRLICDELLDIIDSSNLWDFPFICGSLELINNQLESLKWSIGNIAYILPSLEFLLEFMIYIIEQIQNPVLIIGAIFDCPDWPWPYDPPN